MSKQEKLTDRLLSVPSDFTWSEMVKLLNSFGYLLIKAGKTGGSRRKFVDDLKNVISLHEPRPAKIIKKYVIYQVIEHLKTKGKITDE